MFPVVAKEEVATEKLKKLSKFQLYMTEGHKR
jgi:hypothetical protein